MSKKLKLTPIQIDFLRAMISPLFRRTCFAWEHTLRALDRKGLLILREEDNKVSCTLTASGYAEARRLLGKVPVKMCSKCERPLVDRPGFKPRYVCLNPKCEKAPSYARADMTAGPIKV